MRRSLSRVAAAAALALCASLAQAGLEIQHEPITCVPMDRFARIVAMAKGSSAEGVTRAELQFRVDSASDWYATRMMMTGGLREWSAVLPRPRKPLERFEYRIVMSSATAEAAETRPFTVSVSDASTACRSLLESSPSPIVVTVPPGAPVVPPVPPGFNPVGVVTAQEQIQPAKHGVAKWAILGGVAVAGGIGAAVAVQGSDKPAVPDDIPQFSYLGTTPNPGTTLSLSRDTLQVFVHMSRRPQSALNFTWRFEMRSSPNSAVCVAMGGNFTGAQDPLDLILSSAFVVQNAFDPGFCGSRFFVSQGKLSIRIGDVLVLDTSVPVGFPFEP